MAGEDCLFRNLCLPESQTLIKILGSLDTRLVGQTANIPFHHTRLPLWVSTLVGVFTELSSFEISGNDDLRVIHQCGLRAMSTFLETACTTGGVSGLPHQTLAWVHVVCECYITGAFLKHQTDDLDPMDVSFIREIMISIQNVLVPHLNSAQTRTWDFSVDVGTAMSDRAAEMCERYVRLYIFSTLRVPVCGEPSIVRHPSHLCVRVCLLSTQDATPPVPIWEDGQVFTFRIAEVFPEIA